jgi:molybdopterin-guanine dinucleotide biosynthesis protein A
MRNIDGSAVDPFLNVNTADDLAIARALLSNP